MFALQEFTDAKTLNMTQAFHQKQGHSINSLRITATTPIVQSNATSLSSPKRSLEQDGGAQLQYLQQKIGKLEGSVSNLVLKLDSMRPLLREAQQLQAREPGSMRSSSRPGSRTRQPQAQPANNLQSARSQLQGSLCSNSNYKVVSRQNSQKGVGPRNTSASRPGSAAKNPSTEPVTQPAQDFKLRQQVEEQIKSNRERFVKAIGQVQKAQHQVDQNNENLQGQLVEKVNQQERKVEELSDCFVKLQASIEQLKTKSEERIQLAQKKAQQRQERKEQKKKRRQEMREELRRELTQQLSQEMEQLVQSYKSEYRQQTATAATSPTTPGIGTQLSNSFNKPLNEPKLAEKHQTAIMLESDRKQMTERSVQNTKQTVYQSASSLNDSRKSVNYRSTGSRVEQLPQSEKYISEGKTSMSGDDRSVTQTQPNQSGYLEQIKLALQQLEAYSLRSSEDINDSIEQLVSCINSNTAALSRALDDLRSLQLNARTKQPSSFNERTVPDTANKILNQFKNFSDYTQQEVQTILSQLYERQQECEQNLKVLDKDLLPAQEDLLAKTASKSQGSSTNPDQKEQLEIEKLCSLDQQTKFQACKEHYEALKLHIQNTQVFLKREASSIDHKVTELHSKVVKEIQACVSGQTDASELVDDGREDGIEVSTAQSKHRHTKSHEVVNNLLPVMTGTPSKQSSDFQEVSLPSPQDIGHLLRSHISTIPEEDDHDIPEGSTQNH